MTEQEIVNKGKGSQPNTDRNLDIIRRAVALSEEHKALGEEYGISIQRVGQIIRKPRYKEFVEKCKLERKQNAKG